MPVTPKERMQYVQSLTRLLPVMRTAAGISQEELANSVGVSRQTLSSIESGKRKMSSQTEVPREFSESLRHIQKR